MLFKTLIISALALAAFATDCGSGGKVQCCESVENSKNLSTGTKNIIALLPITADQLTGQVGITCTAVNAVGGIGGGNKCSQQTVCCNNNNFNGVVALGCNPVNVQV